MLARLLVPFARYARPLSTSRFPQHVSEQFVMQLRLPGRTTGTLSTGVVPYANDPMIPSSKYFKPRGLDSTHGLRFMLGPSNPRSTMQGFTLIASPWNEDEHPRDHNGLRIRDYRVACMATKKAYSKKAYHRWRAMRLLRTAAMLILPDKGMKRCDYLLVARAPMRFMDRDQLFLEVERAFVDMEFRIRAGWARNGRRPRPRVPEDLIGKDHAQQSLPKSKGKPTKILQTASTDEQRRIYCISQIVEDFGPLFKQQTSC